MTTEQVPYIRVCLSGVWLDLPAVLAATYLGVHPNPWGQATLPPKHFARVEAIAVWACSTLSPPAVVLETLRAVAGGIVRFSAAFLEAGSRR